MKQPPHQVRNMLLSPPKVSKAKELPKKGQKAEPKQVARKCIIPQKAMASDSDLDVEDYHIVEDANRVLLLNMCLV